MPPLHDLLNSLKARPDVAGALVASDEGLVIDSALPDDMEPEMVAALAATAQRALNPLGDSLGHGRADLVVMEGPGGVSVMGRLESGASLVVVAADEGDLGRLLGDLRQHTPAVSELV